VTLSWSTANATNVVIDQGIGSVSLSGSTPITLTNKNSDTTYILTATGPSNFVSSSVTVRTVPGGAATNRYVRFSPLQLRGAGDFSVQLSEFVFLNGATAITPVSATNTVGGSPGGEGPTNLWDNNTGTKWLCSTNPPAYGQYGLGCRLVFDFGSPTVFDGYYFATANDAPERDPVRWTLEGSDDGTNWTLVECNDVGFPGVPEARQTLSQEPVPLPGDTLLSIEQFVGDLPKVYPGERLVLTWETKAADSVSIDQGIGVVATSGSVTNFPVVDTTYILSALRGALTLTATVTVDVVTSTITNIAYTNFNLAGDELFLIGDTPSPLPGVLPPAPLVGVDTNLSSDARLRLTYDQGGEATAPDTAWFGLPVAVDVGFRTTFGLNMEEYLDTQGAEGISFMVQNTAEGLEAVPTGGNIGNGEFLLSTNALNIVFDAYQNAGDPSAAFVRVVAGDAAELAIVDVTTVPALTNFLGTDPDTNLTFTGFNSNQTPYAVEVTYVPGDLDLSINGVSVLENVVVDLGAIGALDGQGKSYVGFAGQTGGASQNNDVTSWFLNRRPLLKITSYSFNFATSTVLSSGIPGAAGLDETSTTVSFTEGALGFIRVEEE
jgi:hypothetical protein